MSISIEELQKLLADATPGPWCNRGRFLMVNGSCDTFSGNVLGPLAIAAELHETDSEGRNWWAKGDPVANADLMAHSHELATRVIEQQRIIDALAQDASRAAELEVENARLRKLVQPEWFYEADCHDSDRCHFDLNEVLTEDYFWDRPQRGEHVVEISTATSLPSIWAAVRFNCECADPDDCQCDNEMIVTEHASEEAARAALQVQP